LATENSEILISKYNLTVNDLKTLKTDIKAFSDARPKPRNSLTESSSATQELVDLFDDLDEVLNKQIDCLMVKFQDSEPSSRHTCHLIQRLQMRSLAQAGNL
jgi:hypothetical protein